MKGILRNSCTLIGLEVYFVVNSSFLTFFCKNSCRLELLKERERRKEEEVEALKRSMQAGLVRFILEHQLNTIMLMKGFALLLLVV